MPPPEPQPPQAEQPPPPPANPQQIDQLVAPIALYPDQLVSQILMASTYPLEIVEAQRWLQQPGNGQLQGDPLASALEQQPWDPSVKSLVAFPQVIQMMDSNLQWTEQLGNAFLSQQPAVMDSVQRLRQRAETQGHLASTPQQTVTQDQGAIVIQPAQPETVYVPVYNPTVVYGPWPYPAYPPYYFPPPPGYLYATTGIISFGIGIGIIDAFWGWDHWDWHSHRIDIDDRRFEEINRGRAPACCEGVWEHDPGHRHGVPYSSPAARSRFQSVSDTARRNSFRGFAESPQARAATPQAQAQHQIQQQRNQFQRTQVQQPQQAARSSVEQAQHQQTQQRQQVQQQQRQQQVQRQQVQQTQQRQAPVYESFSRGSEVRAQSQRGTTSRASTPAAAPQVRSAPASHENGGGARGGNNQGGGNRGGPATTIETGNA